MTGRACKTPLSFLPFLLPEHPPLFQASPRCFHPLLPSPTLSWGVRFPLILTCLSVLWVLRAPSWAASMPLTPGVLVIRPPVTVPGVGGLSTCRALCHVSSIEPWHPTPASSGVLAQRLMPPPGSCPTSSCSSLASFIVFPHIPRNPLGFCLLPSLLPLISERGRAVCARALGCRPC